VVLALGIAVVFAVVLMRRTKESGNRPGTPPRDLFVTLPAPDAGPPPATDAVLLPPPDAATAPDAPPSAVDAAAEVRANPPPEPDAATAPPEDAATGPTEPDVVDAPPEAPDAPSPPAPDALRRDARIARDTTRTPPPDATVAAPPPGLPERLSDDEVRRTFASIRGTIEDCLGQVGGSGPGTATVQATVAGRMGMVTAVSVNGATGLAALCVRQAVKALRFPPFVQPTMTVTHPF
jgi:hypothetical protein